MRRRVTHLATFVIVLHSFSLLFITIIMQERMMKRLRLLVERLLESSSDEEGEQHPRFDNNGNRLRRGAWHPTLQ